MAAASRVSLKLLVDTQGHKVLFAEANKDFVDFLFHILSLPLGTAIKLLKKDSMVGCLGNLYDSIDNMSETYLQPNLTKTHILNPKIPTSSVAGVPRLLPPDDVTVARKFYSCNDNCCGYVADDPKAKCPDCGNHMGNEVTYVARDVSIEEAAGEGGFVKGVVTYMVMDDLVVKPMSTISSITVLNKFHIKDVGALEERVVNMEMAEGLKLLKASLQCNNVLTSIFLD